MFMKNVFKIIIFSSVLFAAACEEDPLRVSCNQGVFATIKDLSGLDGCGFVFELADSTRLEPHRLLYCGTQPLPKEVTEDPLFNFDFVDGKRVKIGFDEIPDATSICMVGKVVKIKCIEELTLITEQ